MFSYTSRLYNKLFLGLFIVLPLLRVSGKGLSLLAIDRVLVSDP